MSRGTKETGRGRAKNVSASRVVSGLHNAPAAAQTSRSTPGKGGVARSRKPTGHSPSPPSSANRGARATRDGITGRGKLSSYKGSTADNRPAIWSDFYDESSAGAEPSINFIDVPGTPSNIDQKYAAEGSRISVLNTKEQILARCAESDYSKVYEIDLRACNLTSLPSLEAFLRVRSLDLSSNGLTTLDSVKYNKDLRDLKLYDNRIAEIRGLDNLSELSSLQLQHNQIKSIGQGLISLRKLKQLRLDSNYLLKVEGAELCGCVQLTYLDLSHNRIESIAAVTALPNLQELYASDNCIRNLPDLSPCRKLDEIDLSSNKLSDMSGLKGATSLTILRLSKNHLSRVDSLGQAISLRDLYLDHNQIAQLAPLASLAPGLEVLDVSENRVAAWSEVMVLACLESLHELSISGNPFCLPGGDKPSYHSDIAHEFNSLRVLNRAMLQRGDTDKLNCAPPMRPMSAAYAITSRQVESQIAVTEACLKDLEASLDAKFSALRSSVSSLPCRPNDTRPGSALSKRPASRHGARSRLMEARLFAEHNNGGSDCF